MKQKFTWAVCAFVAVVFGAHSLRSAGDDQAVQFHRSGDKIEILVGGHFSTTYHFEAEVAKPYFQPLRSARGTLVTRDFPIGNTIPAEHLHDDSLEPHELPRTSATATSTASTSGKKPPFPTTAAARSSASEPCCARSKR